MNTQTITAPFSIIMQSEQIPAPPSAVGSLRVAAYCRVSTFLPSQRSSLAAQASHYRDLILRNPGWEFAGIYLDPGVSATGAGIRPSFQRMLSDCALGKIDLILTKSISRFARNASECIGMVRTLSALGIPIRFEKENIDTFAMDSELVLSLLACFAEEESRSISQNLKWGLRKRFESGSYRPSTPPYGYRKSQSTLVVAPQEAAVVRHIFDRLLSGCGAGAVAAELNERGIPTRRGNPWAYSAVRAIAVNPVYIGDLLCQKTYVDEHFRQRPNSGTLKQYYYVACHEPIIDREAFALAAAVFRREPRRARQKHPFSGRIFCAQCGCAMTRRQAKGIVTFVCSSRRKHTARCGNPPEREENIRNAFLTALNKLAFIQALPRGRVPDGAYGLSRKPDAGALAAAEAALEKNRAEQSALAAAMAVEPAADLRRRIVALLAEQTRLVGERSRLRSCAEAAVALRSFLAEWQTTADPSDFPAELFPSLVARVEVKSKASVTFRFSCGLAVTERRCPR